MKKGELIFKWARLTLFVIIGIAIIVSLRKCNCNGGGVRPVKADTITIIKDSIVTHTIHDTSYVPRLVKEYVPYPFQINHIDTLLENVDSAAILKDYLTSRHYSDTQRIEHGTIVIEDDIFMNKITNRRLITDIRTVDHTTTITVTKPPKTIPYIGFNATGTSDKILYAVGVGAGIKTKKNRIYDLSVSITRDGKYLYQLGYKVPLRKQ